MSSQNIVNRRRQIQGRKSMRSIPINVSTADRRTFCFSYLWHPCLECATVWFQKVHPGHCGYMIKKAAIGLSTSRLQLVASFNGRLAKPIFDRCTRRPTHYRQLTLLYSPARSDCNSLSSLDNQCAFLSINRNSRIVYFCFFLIVARSGYSNNKNRLLIRTDVDGRGKNGVPLDSPFSFDWQLHGLQAYSEYLRPGRPYCREWSHWIINFRFHSGSVFFIDTVSRSATPRFIWRGNNLRGFSLWCQSSAKIGRQIVTFSCQRCSCFFDKPYDRRKWNN